ncbi:MAG: hypothetical protein N3F05_01150 [Candidatus Diapherotrites archaeon]|nr:hypothetical protein [Candidatus Diapherotrites archaeon]
MEGASRELIGRCIERLSYLQLKMRGSNWAELSSNAFVRQADSALEELGEIEKILLEISKNVKEPKEHEFEEIVREHRKLITTIKRNIEYEKNKIAKDHHVAPPNPELFASLQQKVLSLMLRTRFFMERLMLHVGRRETANAGKIEQGRLLELLEQKEQELQELKRKYEDVKKSVFFSIEEKSAADLEQELSKIMLAFEKEKRKLEETFADYRHKIASLQSEFMQLADRLHEAQRRFEIFCEKSSELVHLLKKERDFAKKLVMDIEAEVLELRNTYSNELLKLEQAKLEAKKSSEKEYEARIRALEDEIIAKEELLKHFRDMAASTDSEKKELKERIAFLNAAMAAREKENREKNHKQKSE